MKQHWTKLELMDSWTLSAGEREYINKKNCKLVVVIKMRYFDQQGYFPNSSSDIPLVIVEYVANQLAVEVKEIDKYQWQNRISQIHNQEIREYYGFRKFNNSDDELIKEFVEKKFLKEALPVNRIVGAVYQLLKKKRIEPPSVQETYKYINNIYVKCEQQFFDSCMGVIGINKQKDILKLLDQDGNNQTILNNIRGSAGKVSSSTIIKELAKLTHIESTSLLDNRYFDKISRKLLKKYHDKVAISAPSLLLRIKESNQSKFYALLACFCRYKGARIIDNLVEIFIRKFHKIQRSAKEMAKEELWQYYTDLDKDSLLYQLIDISLKHPDGIIKDKIYSGVGGKEKLEQSKQSQKSSRRLARELEYKNLSSLYSHHYRKHFLLILKHFNLRNYVKSKITDVVKLIIDSLEDKECQDKYYPDKHTIIVNELLTKEDLEIIKNSEGKFNRLYYELAILNLFVYRQL